MKCGIPGITYTPDGVNEMDMCLYDTIQRIEAVEGIVIEIDKCRYCGHIELSWYRGSKSEP